MPAPTTVDQILGDLEARHEKTAQVVAQPDASSLESTRNDLDQALADIQGATKTASTNGLGGQDAVAYLEKTAAEIEAAEANALIKEAELFGAAFLHSFITQANQYAEAAGTKVAAQQPVAQGPHIDELVKSAAVQGSQDMGTILGAMGQLKQASVQEPHIDELVKTAAAQGAQDTETILNAMNQPHIDTLVKTAAENGAADMAVVLEGTSKQANYDDGVQDGIEKLADFCHDSFNRGYADIEAVVSA